MPGHSSFPPPIVLPYLDHETSATQGLGAADDPLTSAVTYISMLDHVGTHVDAPLHVDPAGASIDEVPLERFTGPAVCLDLRDTPDRGEIDQDALDSAEREAGVQIRGQIVLLCTGFHRRHWPAKPDVYTEDPYWATQNQEAMSSHPGLTAAATHWLADRGSTVHGVEGPSTDRAGTTDYPSHRVCRERGLIHYEWLVNLEELVGAGEFHFTGFPIKWLRGTGSPVRAVAHLTS
jgi:kynurenine formamidase